MNPYLDLAQDIWTKATQEDLVILSNALQKAFKRQHDRLASPITNDPAQPVPIVHPSNHAGSSLGVAFKQQSDSVEHEKKICNRLNSLYNGRCSD